MKGLRSIAWLLMGLYFVNLTPPSFSAKNQNVQAVTAPAPSPTQMLNNLQTRLEHANAELDSIRAQTNGPLTTESRRLLLERIERLENELECLKADLASIKQHPLNGSATSTSATFGCCFQKQEYGQTISCAGNLCPRSLSVIKRQQVKDLVITFENEDGRLSGGPNSFCVRFTDPRSNRMVEVEGVQLDVTFGIRRVKAVRAVAQVNPNVKGVYCGQMTLGVAGEWELVLRCVGPAGRGRIRFVTTVG